MGDKWDDVNAPWRELASGSAFGGDGSTRLRRIEKGGKQKNYRVDIKSDALLVNMDARDANKTFGAALQQIVAKQIQAVTKDASEATIERRMRAYNDGKSKWYRRNYAGGRTGEMRPSNTSTALLNDSGRLTVTTIRPRISSDGSETATINFPINRVNPDYLGDYGRVLTVLQAEVPIMGGRADAGTQADLHDAISQLADGSVATSLAEQRRKQLALRRLQLQVAKTIGKALLGG